MNNKNKSENIKNENISYKIISNKKEINLMKKNENNINKNFPKINIKKESSNEIKEIKKSVTKQDSVISGKTKDTNKYSESLIPLSSFLSNNSIGDDSQSNLQDFIKNGKKEIIFQDSNSKEILLENEKTTKVLKIKIKETNKNKNSFSNEEKSDSIKFNEFKKKKDLYDANKVLDIIQNTYLGFNYDDEEEDENEETLINDDYGNLDEIISDNNHINNININAQPFEKTFLSKKDKDDIQIIRNQIESKLGKDFTKFLIHYVSSRTDKELLKFDQKEIEKKLKRDYENKKIKVSYSLLNESFNLLPEIYSIVIAERMDDNLK